MNAELVKDNNYACPICKQSLTPTTNGLYCQNDAIEYPVKNGIPDFITENFTKSTSPFLRSINEFDTLAKIYEGPSWYGTMDTAFSELGLPSIEEIAQMMTDIVAAKDGLGLDVACGTGFFTRSLSQKMRLVYGIDISMGMLEKAVEYAREKGIENIRFGRSKAEKLPFPDGVFDGVTCSGALHTFQDTAEVLREMARVMKTGAPLAVTTMVKQDLSVLKKFYERIKASNPFSEEETQEALHLFDVEELDNYLSQAGFTGFAYDISGPFILFHAEKG